MRKKYLKEQILNLKNIVIQRDKEKMVLNKEYSDLAEYSSNSINEYKKTLKYTNNELTKANRLIDMLTKSEQEKNTEIILLKNEVLTFKQKLEIKDNEIKELRSDRYLVKKITPGRPRKGQTIGVKSGVKESKIIAKMYKEIEDEK